MQKRTTDPFRNPPRFGQGSPQYTNEPTPGLSRVTTAPIQPSSDTHQLQNSNFSLTINMSGQETQPQVNATSYPNRDNAFNRRQESGGRMTPPRNTSSASPPNPLQYTPPSRSSTAHVTQSPVSMPSQTYFDLSDHSKLAKLGNLDTVLVLDNTPSMQGAIGIGGERTRWGLLQESVYHLADTITAWDRDGIDMYFLNPEKVNPNNPRQPTRQLLDEQNITDPKVVLQKLIGIEDMLEHYMGGTFFFPCLEKAIEDKRISFRDYYESRNDRRPRPASERVARPKALNIIFITDGEAHDHEEVVEYLTNLADDLHEWKAPKNYIGIQFVQIGNDADAAAWLRKLDDELKNEPRVRDRDMIDTTPFDSPEHSGMSPQEFQDLLTKILLGAIDKDEDARANSTFSSMGDDD